MWTRDINWGKTDVISPTGLFFSRRFQMFGLSARVLAPGNVVEAEIQFDDFWYAGAGTYMGQTSSGDMWEILKLRCNCKDD